MTVAMNDTLEFVKAEKMATQSSDRTIRNQLFAGVVLAAVVGSGLFSYFFAQARTRQLEAELNAAMTERWSLVSNRFVLGSQAVPDMVVDNIVTLPRNAVDGDGFLAIASDQGELLLYSIEPGKVTRENMATLPKLDSQPSLNSGFESFKKAIADKATSTTIGAELWSYRRVTDKSEWIVIAVAPLIRVWIDTATGALIVLIGIAGIGALVVWRLTAKLDPTLNLIQSASDRLTGKSSDYKGGKIAGVETAFTGLISQISEQQERIKTEVAMTVQQQERLSQARASEVEENVIQQEVSILLDVVSALEDGDLTVQAEVSDRATGLVADTLNRLTEQLANIIAQVLNTAQEVATGSKDLEQMAKVVAQNTVEQAQSVTRGQELTEQVATSAQNSTALVKSSTQSLLEVQDRVLEGQDAILRLGRSIEILQKGTGQIVLRMKTLGEFVGLAEQFVQDQGQIASLTQVLAINATLVAARAAEQRDPRQFVGVAREFEAIAGQVNTLATQTNEGLNVLQQRTSQIQAVVSSVDSEIQQLDNLVETLSSGVKRSKQAFSSVQTETEQVVEIGSRVTQSSIEIAKAAATTAEYMSEIAKIADQTANLTRNTKAQAESMGIVAQQLLDGISFFRLPANAKIMAAKLTPRELTPRELTPRELAQNPTSDLAKSSDFSQSDFSQEVTIESNGSSNLGMASDRDSVMLTNRAEAEINPQISFAQNSDWHLEQESEPNPETKVAAILTDSITRSEPTETFAQTLDLTPSLEAVLDTDTANFRQDYSAEYLEDYSVDFSSNKAPDFEPDQAGLRTEENRAENTVQKVDQPTELTDDLTFMLSSEPDQVGDDLTFDSYESNRLETDLEEDADELDLDLEAFLSSESATELMTVDTNFDRIFSDPESAPSH
jgi:methyl-accepting chemotaxis protein